MIFFLFVSIALAKDDCSQTYLFMQLMQQCNDHTNGGPWIQCSDYPFFNENSVYKGKLDPCTVVTPKEYVKIIGDVKLPHNPGRGKVNFYPFPALIVDDNFFKHHFGVAVVNRSTLTVLCNYILVQADWQGACNLQEKGQVYGLQDFTMHPERRNTVLGDAVECVRSCMNRSSTAEIPLNNTMTTNNILISSGILIAFVLMIFVIMIICVKCKKSDGYELRDYEYIDN